jgi:4-amino-4-deoxy-L-arabinose transferase-like glycosyltransferase
MKMYWKLAFICIAVLLLRLPFSFVPFQHPDEGTFLSYGMSIVESRAVYGTDFMILRGPGGYYIYAILISLFGESVFIMHLFGIFWHITITLLVFFIGCKLFNERIAILGSFFYSIFSFSMTLPDAIFLNIEVLALLPLLASFLCFINSINLTNINNIKVNTPFSSILYKLLSGVFLGLTFSICQTMAVIMPFLLIYPMLKISKFHDSKSKFDIQKSIIIILGFLIGLVVGYAQPLLSGEIENAIYASVLHGFFYPPTPWLSRFISLITRFLIFTLYQPLLWITTLWIIVCIGGTWKTRQTNKYAHPKIILIFVFLLETLGILVKGRTAAHGFFALLPFASLLLSYEYLTKWFPEKGAIYKNHLSRLIIIIGCIVPVLHFIFFPAGAIMKEYSILEYIKEARNTNTPLHKAAEFISTYTSKEDRIFCLTDAFSFDRFYFMSKRLPATAPLSIDFYDVYSTEDALENLREFKRLIVILPSPSLGGKMESNIWQNKLLDMGYSLIQKFEWQEHTRFYSGKRLNISDEWIEVYSLGY